MLNSSTFDLVIGMIFILLTLSLVVSAVREAIEARLRTRSKHLAHGLRELLGSDELVKRLYEHPLIKALYDGTYDARAAGYRGHRFFSWIPALFGSLGGTTTMPSYVPARTFALAILDLARAGRLGTGSAAATGSSTPLSLADLRTSLLAVSNASPVADGLLAAIAPAGDDVDRAIDAIQRWYDASMDRVSGWYKRESQHILFWLGVIVAVSMNVDSIQLTKFLAANPEARSRLVTEATNAGGSSDMKDAVDRLRAPPASAAASDPVKDLRVADIKVSNAIHTVTDLNLPIGWNHTSYNDFMVLDARTAWTVLGWFVTAFFLSFGAPFWFDLLNKLMVIRSTVKPREKSPEESTAGQKT